MAIKKNKILLNEESVTLDMNVQMEDGHLWHEQAYEHYYGDNCSGCGANRYWNCYCAEWETYRVEDALGNIRTLCIPTGKEYLRNKKIEDLLRDDLISEPISNLHSQLLQTGLVSE